MGHLRRMTEHSPLSSYPVRLPIRVAWGEMDAFAHLNNTVYFRYFESARIAYFEGMEILTKGGSVAGVGPILASTSCRFRAPVTYPDQLQVGARVSELGGDRFTMEYAVWSEKLERMAATGEGVIVSYDYAAGAKVDLPEAWRARIVELEGSVGHAL